MKRTTICVLAGMSSVLTAGSVAAAIYDPSSEFSAINNPNAVWSYGYSQSLGGSFILHTDTYVNNGVNQWITELSNENNKVPNIFHNSTGGTILMYPGTPLMAPGELALHPGQHDEFSILRFTAPATEQYSLAGLFFGSDIVGTTTDVHILVNGSSVFNGSVNGFGLGTGPSFALREALQAGDRLDVVVGFGSNGDYYFDSTGVSMQIATGTDTPKPSLPEWSSPGEAVPDSGSTTAALLTGFAGIALTARLVKDRRVERTTSLVPMLLWPVHLRNS